MQNNNAKFKTPKTNKNASFFKIHFCSEKLNKNGTQTIKIWGWKLKNHSKMRFWQFLSFHHKFRSSSAVVCWTNFNFSGPPGGWGSQPGKKSAGWLNPLWGSVTFGVRKPLHKTLAMAWISCEISSGWPTHSFRPMGFPPASSRSFWMKRQSPGRWPATATGDPAQIRKAQDFVIICTFAVEVCLG